MDKLIANIPDELKKKKSWVGFVLKPDGKRMNKIPMNVMTGKPARTNDPKTWTDFEMALNLSIERNYSGIGFCFTPPYVGIDLDHCVKDRQIAPYALGILKALNSYSEYSPSGTGIHIICRGDIQKATKISNIGLEIYARGRFFTFTGERLTDYPSAIFDRTLEIKNLQEHSSKTAGILKLISKSKNADKFQKLFSGNWQGDYPSQSEADLALSNKLAFWSGKDPVLMDALFRQSGLMRDKWDEKHFGDGKTYGEVVIEKAVASCQETYHASSERISLGKKIPQGEILTRDCEENIKDFLRDQQGNPYVVLPFQDHHEVCPTQSTRFRNWMAKRYREKYGSPPSVDGLKQAIIQMEARCEDSKKVELFNRVGWHGGAIYYDLSTHDWRGVRIDKFGWEIVSLPSIFKRYQHQETQVLPEKGRDPKGILEFCNIQKDDQCLFLSAVASFFIPNIPHIILSQNGEQGSGKSNNSRKIKGLGDPSKVMLTSTPKDLEQAQMTAEKHWISTFDNLSKIFEWFSDFLCRGVTGEGDMKRSLYTNDDEFIRAYRRCFVLNGIGTSLWRPDLLDRAIIFEIPILQKTRSEKELEEKWQRELPGILGGFFTAISKAMGIVDKVTGHEKFRMADFAQWGAALAEAMSFTQEQFFKRYQESVDRKWQDTAEESVLGNKIVNFIGSNGGEWKGSTSELLSELNPDSHEKGIPTNANWLSKELMRIAPVMRNVGIDIVRKSKREGGTGKRIFIMRRINEKTGRENGREPGVSGGLFCEPDDGADSPRPF